MNPLNITLPRYVSTSTAVPLTIVSASKVDFTFELIQASSTVLPIDRLCGSLAQAEKAKAQVILTMRKKALAERLFVMVFDIYSPFVNVFKSSLKLHSSA
jgi:hypothetical protein